MLQNRHARYVFFVGTSDWPCPLPSPAAAAGGRELMLDWSIISNSNCNCNSNWCKAAVTTATAHWTMHRCLRFAQVRVGSQPCLNRYEGAHKAMCHHLLVVDKIVLEGRLPDQTHFVVDVMTHLALAASACYHLMSAESICCFASPSKRS